MEINEYLKKQKCIRCKNQTLHFNGESGLYECSYKYCKARFTKKEIEGGTYVK